MLVIIILVARRICFDRSEFIKITLDGENSGHNGHYGQHQHPLRYVFVYQIASGLDERYGEILFCF